MLELLFILLLWPHQHHGYDITSLSQCMSTIVVNKVVAASKKYFLFINGSIVDQQGNPSLEET